MYFWYIIPILCTLMAKYIDKLLKQTFLELVKEKDINSITVSMLCEKAEINRKTFYNHYKNIGELLADILVENYKKDVDDNTGPYTWNIAFENIMKSLKNDKKFVYNVLNSKYSETIEFRCKKAIDDSVLSWVNKSQEYLKDKENIFYNLNSKQKKCLVTYYSSMMYSMLLNWILDGMKEPIKEYIDLIGTLSNEGVFVGIKKLSAK